MPKTGVQISYQRFLGDSAPGIVFSLFLMAAVFWQIPIFGRTCNIDPAALDENVIIGFSVLAVMLVSPLGLFINSLSYIILGRWEKLGVNFFLSHGRFGFANVLQNYFFYQWKDFYQIDEPGLHNRPVNWYGFLEIINSVMAVYSPGLLQGRSHVLGVAQFARSFSLILLFVFSNMLVNRMAGVEFSFYFAGIMLLLFLVLMYTVAYLAAYSAVKGLSTAYTVLVCSPDQLEKDKKPKKISGAECMHSLKKALTA